MQAISLARRMAGKKGAVVQLQTEVNNEEDWEKLLTKQGLIVVDIYSEWCGPCVGMIGNLKKIKLEIGGDLLHLAIAKSDEIEVLARFRNKSEPTWMLVSNGLLVSVLFGVNAPKLMQLIEVELAVEEKVIKGEIPRRGTPIGELSAEEQERDQLMRFEAEEGERKGKAQEDARRRIQRDQRFAHAMTSLCTDTCILCLPQTIPSPPDGDGSTCVILPHLQAICLDLDFQIADSVRLLITPEMAQEIFYRDSIAKTDDFKAALKSGQCIAYLVRCSMSSPLAEQIGKIEKVICEAVNNVELPEEWRERDELITPHAESLSMLYKWMRPIITSEEGEEKESQESEDAEDGANDEEQMALLKPTDVVGCWTPSTPLSKCAAYAQLFPLRAEKVCGPPIEDPPSRLTLIFETSKAEECYAIAEEQSDLVLGIGFFSIDSSLSVKTAKMLARTRQKFERIAERNVGLAADAKLIMVVSGAGNEPLLSLAALGALYISSNVEVGGIDAEYVFPYEDPWLKQLRGEEEEKEDIESLLGDDIITEEEKEETTEEVQLKDAEEELENEKLEGEKDVPEKSENEEEKTEVQGEITSPEPVEESIEDEEEIELEKKAIKEHSSIEDEEDERRSTIDKKSSSSGGSLRKSGSKKSVKSVTVGSAHKRSGESTGSKTSKGKDTV